MSTRRLCILGAGNMGRALIGGLLRSGTRAELLSVGESVPAARELLARELGVSATADNAAAIAGAAGHRARREAAGRGRRCSRRSRRCSAPRARC